jgi:hypothetical protein
MLTLNLPPSPGYYVEPKQRAVEVFKAAALTVIGQREKRNPLDLNPSPGTRLFLKDAQPPANTSDPNYASPLLRQELLAEFHYEMSRESLGLALTRYDGVLLSFDGFQNIVLPKRKKGRSMTAAFRSEGDAVRVGSLNFESTELKPYNVSVIGVASEELLDNVPDLTNYLRKTITQDTAHSVDVTMFDEEPASAVRPAGMLYALEAGHKIVGSGSVVNDITATLRVMLNANQGSNLIWAAHPNVCLHLNTVLTQGGSQLLPETGNNALCGLYLMKAPQLPQDRLLLINPKDIRIAFEFLGFTETNEGTVHLEDTNPLPIVDSNGVAAATTMTLFQSNAYAVRANWRVSWALLRESGIAWVSDIDLTNWEA